MPRRSRAAVSAVAISSRSSISSTREGCCSLSRGASAFSSTAGSAPYAASRVACPSPAVTNTGTSAATAAWRRDCRAVRVIGPVSGSTNSAAGNAAICASTSSREFTITGR